ncbi:MAG TPA: DNA-binding domain-containing protein [Candidatus Binatia bacterium]
MSAPHALASVQSALASALTAPETSWAEDLLAGVVPGGTLDAAGALAVYRDGYFWRLTEQLGETYQTIWRALGDEGFHALCRAYIAAHRSSSYNLSDYGRDFGDFLEGRPETADALFLPELARLERTFHDVFHSPAHCGMDAAALAALGDLSGVRFELGPSVRLLASKRAVHGLFLHREDEEAPDVELERPQWLLMFKQDTEVRVHEIDAAGHDVIAALARGEAVDEALGAAAARFESFGSEEASGLFETIALCGIVARVRRS